MFRAILTTVLALALISACLLGLSQLASAVLGRVLSAAELAAAAVVLVAAIFVALLCRKRHAQRKYLEMQDSALW
ncbi:hypothetical protein [Polaromonas sp. C04]|uniref:hypothetical protein n=1 Tax=Polaromonas sp. C04 TaxID=1945857 RepID=UPI000987995F|nr:hypothetical protein [Polaromonas sp. C04]OOG57989.1 hypothetical protein B0E49_03870 [Polaromonas sp. C04]